MLNNSCTNPVARSVAGPQLVWAALMIGTSGILSFGFACAVPLAGFAAAAALTLQKKSALGLVIAAFLINQVIGFVWLHYPLDPTTLAWGAVMGVVGITTTLVAIWTGEHARLRNATGLAAVVFLEAFVVYEGLLFLTTAFSGSGFEAYAGPVVVRILLINSGSFAALVAAHKLLSAGIAARHSLPQLTPNYHED